MGKPPNRIRELRVKAGLSLERLAEMAGTSNQQLSKLELGKARLTTDWMERLAPHLGVKPPELMLESVAEANDNGRLALPRTKQNGFVQIEEVDIQAGAGPEGQISYEVAETQDGFLVDILPSKGNWVMPRELFAQVAPAGTEGLKIVSVRGDSMMPRFRPGQRVMVDTADKLPSPPGVFLVWDGFSLVIKQVEVIPFSEPPRVRLTSANGLYSPYERTLDEAYIQGRVIGVWEWT